MKKLSSILESVDIREAYIFHINNGIPISQNVFRPHSSAYYELFRYAKTQVNERHKMSGFEQMIMETDIGELADYNGEIVPLDHPLLEEAKPELNKPKRGGSKKFYVFVKNKKGNIIKVQFGDTSGLDVNFSDLAARKSFAARHKCHLKNDKTKPGYWACRLPSFARELGLKGGGNFFW